MQSGLSAGHCGFPTVRRLEVTAPQAQLVDALVAVQTSGPVAMIGDFVDVLTDFTVFAIYVELLKPYAEP